MQYILSIIILVFCGVVVGLMYLLKPEPETVQPETAIPVVEALTVEPKTVQLVVHSQGTVTPRTETMLTPEVSGRIVAVAPSFETGGFFEKNDVLVWIDPSDYIAAAAKAKADLARARLNLAQEKAESEQALEDWNNLGRGTPSDLVLRKPQLAEAHARVESARSDLELAELNLERTEIKAPYAGKIREKHVDVGQSVQRAASIASIYAVDYAEIRLPISDREAGLIDLPLAYRGETAPETKPKASLNSQFGGRQYTWEGIIDRVEDVIDTRSRLIYLVAQVADPYAWKNATDRPPLRVGLFVEAEIQGKTIENAFTIPRLALVEKDTVLVIGSDSKLRSRKVDVLQSDETSAVITSGLETGERICVSPVEFVIEEMPVSVGSPKSLRSSK